MMKTKKLLLFVPSLDGGGAERVASLWIRGFVARGYQISVILNCDLKRHPIVYAIPNEVEIYNIFCPKRNLFISYSIRLKKLRSFVKSIAPDIIITVLHPNLLFFKIVLGFSSKYKIINTEHNSFEWPKKGLTDYFNYFNKFYVNKFASIVTVLTDSDYRYIGDRLNNVVVLPNPLTFKPLQRVPPKKKQVLAVGRLDSWYVKGFDVLIKAWSRICMDYQDWTLHIIGDGSLDNLDFLKKMCSTQAATNVIFESFTNSINVMYSESSLFVLSSRTEGFGMVLTEAMSFGCACIASDFNGRQREILGDSEYGIICEPGNDESLMDALRRMIDNEALRKSYQEKALLRASKYELNTIMNEWEDIFKRL